MSMGSGTIIRLLCKQKLSTQRSTKTKLLVADNTATLMIWTKLFMEKQGYRVKDNTLFQENKSAILLEENR